MCLPIHYARFLLLVFIFLFSVTSYAAEKVYLDKRTQSESLQYNLTFSANEDSETGHSFVTFSWSDEESMSTKFEGAGFYPSLDAKKGYKVGFGGKGVLHNDSWEKADLVLSVRINKKQYEKARDIYIKWKKPTPYFLLFSDCTTFVGDVARSIGLSTPYRVTARYPMEYVKEMISINSP